MTEATAATSNSNTKKTEITATTKTEAAAITTLGRRQHRHQTRGKQTNKHNNERQQDTSSNQNNERQASKQCVSSICSKHFKRFAPNNSRFMHLRLEPLRHIAFMVAAKNSAQGTLAELDCAPTALPLTPRIWLKVFPLVWCVAQNHGRRDARVCLSLTSGPLTIPNHAASSGGLQLKQLSTGKAGFAILEEVTLEHLNFVLLPALLE